MHKQLIACFSAGGVTEQVARRLAKVTGADLFQIRPVEPYTKADLNWMNPLARCNKEKVKKKDVPVIGSVENMEAYDTIFLGFPIWYVGAPNIVQTFLKGYDLSGKKIMVFATSGGSGIGKTAEKLKPFIGPAEIVKATLFAPSISEEALKEWAEE